MHLMRHKKILFSLSVIVLAVFFGTMLVHPFAPHEHGKVHMASDTASSVFHTGVVERGQGVTLAIVAFVVITLFLRYRAKLLPAIFQRGFQQVDIPIFLSLYLAFSGGVHNTKVY